MELNNKVVSVAVVLIYLKKHKKGEIISFQMVFMGHDLVLFIEKYIETEWNEMFNKNIFLCYAFYSGLKKINKTTTPQHRIRSLRENKYFYHLE